MSNICCKQFYVQPTIKNKNDSKCQTVWLEREISQKGERLLIIGRYASESKSVSLCLFKALFCFFIWTISETSLFVKDGSISNIVVSLQFMS